MREAEVLVRLVASGICRTDIDFCDHYWYGGNEAPVLGHEGAGGAEKVGRGGSDRRRTIAAAPVHILTGRLKAMATTTGKELAQNIRQAIEDLKKTCEGVDEGTASRAPAGKWSPKEILSHLLGEEGTSHLLGLQAFLDQDTPRLDLEAGNAHFSTSRFQMRFGQLLTEVEQEYDRIARFAEGLSEEQLERQARIPMLKESPLSEYPTLKSWLGLLGGAKESHLQFHIKHLREVLQEMGVPKK